MLNIIFLFFIGSEGREQRILSYHRKNSIQHGSHYFSSKVFLRLFLSFSAVILIFVVAYSTWYITAYQRRFAETMNRSARQETDAWATYMDRQLFTAQSLCASVNSSENLRSIFQTSYMVVTGLGLYNTRLAMILPVLLSTYNMMICRSAMESIPQDLFENAALEGASELYQMLHIAIPLIKPTLAVLTLYYAVARYNDFFSAVLYIGDTDLQPLQMFLRKVLLMSSTEILQKAGSTGAAAAAQATLKIRYVCIVLATVPIFCITPFVQKYLVSGTMLGAVKG